MKMSCKINSAFAFTMVLASALPGPQARQAQAQSPVPKGIELSPGTCPKVSSGDFITLEWNPGFTTVPGGALLREFNLKFVHEDDRAFVDRRGPSLMLRASGGTSAEAENSVTAASNGYFQMRYRIPAARNGAYWLVGAEAIANPVSGLPEGRPQMTNDPSRSYFCLEIDNSGEARRRGNSSLQSGQLSQ